MSSSDIPVFVRYQRDPESAHVAALGQSEGTDELTIRWTRILKDPTACVRAIVFGDEVVGYVATFCRDEEYELTYWVDRQYWGRGIATTAVMILLAESPRPVYARTASDNARSIGLLKRCGFGLISSTTTYAPSRGTEIDELVFRLS